MKTIQCVLDNNVLISAALFPQSIPGQALVKLQKLGKILLSWPVIEELSEVLTRKKFYQYLTQEERENFLLSLLKESKLIGISHFIQACRDPKDNKLLELAIDGNANYLITGDQDLLSLHPFKETPILSAADFLLIKT